jgi:hypothetical protein
MVNNYIYIYNFESIYIFFYIINRLNKIGDNGAKSLGENFVDLPITLHTFHLNLR